MREEALLVFHRARDVGIIAAVYGTGPSAGYVENGFVTKMEGVYNRAQGNTGLTKKHTRII